MRKTPILTTKTRDINNFLKSALNKCNDDFYGRENRVRVIYIEEIRKNANGLRVIKKLKEFWRETREKNSEISNLYKRKFLKRCMDGWRNCVKELELERKKEKLANIFWEVQVKRKVWNVLI